MPADGEWPARSIAVGQDSVYMPDENDARAVLRLTGVGSNEVIAIVLLFIEAGREAECLKTVLEVCAYAVDACFGVGARVDVYNGLEVVEVFVYVFLGEIQIIVVFYITPSSLNFSISVGS